MDRHVQLYSVLVSMNVNICDNLLISPLLEIVLGKSCIIAII